MMTVDEHLVSLIVELNRSFLQYVDECWPWTTGQKAAAEKIQALAAMQQEDVGILYDVLLDLGAEIDFGTFPTEYTASQYSSLDALMGWLTESQDLVVDSAERVATACGEDQFLKEVTAAILSNEQLVQSELRSLNS